jgi:hypothetical protein
MDGDTQTKFLTAFGNSFDEPWSGSIHEWGENNINLPSTYAMAGSFSVAPSPYLKEIFDAILDPTVESVYFLGGRQILKSGTQYISIAFWCSENPGPIMLLMQNDAMAETFVKTRLLPILQNCKSLEDISVQYSSKTGDISVAQINIKVSGHKDSVLIGSSIQMLLIDELAEWENQDAFLKAIHSTNAFIGKRKILITSTLGTEGDRLSKLVAPSQVYRWHVCCPKCNQYQKWYWNEAKTKSDGTIIKGAGYGITWLKCKDSDGDYDYDKTGDTAYWECKYCSHQVKELVIPKDAVKEEKERLQSENEKQRTELNNHSKFVLEKEGDSSIKTFIVPSWVNPKITFKSKIISYLQSKLEAKYGNKKSLMNFYQHVLGEEWNSTRTTWSKPKVTIENYDSNTEWPEEYVRCMSVDWQTGKMEFYFVIFASDKVGNLRLIKYGKCYSWEHIAEYAEENKVARTNVVVDAGDKQEDVFKEIIKYGQWIDDANGQDVFESWLAFKGDRGGPKGSYEHPDGLRRYIDAGTEYSVGNDMPIAIMHLWAANPVRNIFATMRDGKSQEKLVFNTVDQDFVNQLFSESPETNDKGETVWIHKNKDKLHKDNHYWDACCQAIAFFLLVGIPLGGSRDIKKE